VGSLPPDEAKGKANCIRMREGCKIALPLSSKAYEPAAGGRGPVSAFGGGGSSNGRHGEEGRRSAAGRQERVGGRGGPHVVPPEAGGGCEEVVNQRIELLHHRVELRLPLNRAPSHQIELCRRRRRSRDDGMRGVAVGVVTTRPGKYRTTA
jgi:hypothetical protein